MITKNNYILLKKNKSTFNYSHPGYRINYWFINYISSRCSWTYSASPSLSSSRYFSLGSDKKINISNYSVVNNVSDFHTLDNNYSPILLVDGIKYTCVIHTSVLNPLALLPNAKNLTFFYSPQFTDNSIEKAIDNKVSDCLEKDDFIGAINFLKPLGDQARLTEKLYNGNFKPNNVEIMDLLTGHTVPASKSEEFVKNTLGSEPSEITSYMLWRIGKLDQFIRDCESSVVGHLAKAKPQVLVDVGYSQELPKGLNGQTILDEANKNVNESSLIKFEPLNTGPRFAAGDVEKHIPETSEPVNWQDVWNKVKAQVSDSNTSDYANTSTSTEMVKLKYKFHEFGATHKLVDKAASPLDQYEIRDLLSLDLILGDLHISITDISLYLVIVAFLCYALNLLVKSYLKFLHLESGLDTKTLKRCFHISLITKYYIAIVALLRLLTLINSIYLLSFHFFNGNNSLKRGKRKKKRG